MRADKQTDRQTNILITILRTPPEGDVTIGSRPTAENI